MSKVFVTGASGLLGRSLIKNLVKKGFEVIALVHKTEIKDYAGLTLIKGDIADKSSLGPFLQSVDTIFHLAGVVTDWAPEELYYKVHVDGTNNILEAAKKFGVKRIVYISTIDIFAHEKFEVINEDTPYTTSQNPYRKSKLMAYELIAKAVSRGDISAVTLCPAWIYGPGDKIFIAEIIKQLKTKSFMYIGKKSNYTPLIFADNLSKLMIEVNEKFTQFNHETFLVSDIDINWERLVNMICDRLKVEYPRISLPYSLSYFIGMLMEFYGWIFGRKERPLLTRTAVEAVGHSIKVETKKINSLLNYRPYTPFNSAMDDTIDDVLLNE